MAVITIPFDYDLQRDGGSVIPIYLNDTDDNGETIFFGWIEAVIPVQDKLRAVSRVSVRPNPSAPVRRPGA